MSLADYYVPAYVNACEQLLAECQCGFCQQEENHSPLVLRRWGNEVRSSAHLGCETVCRQTLFDPLSFVLSATDCQSDAEEWLSERDRTINQLALNLATHPTLNVEQQLYTIGILLSRTLGMNDLASASLQPLSLLTKQLQFMGDSGVLHEQFLALPPIPIFPLRALRALGNISLTIDTEPMPAMLMALKLNELATMSDAHLKTALESIGQTWMQEGVVYFDAHPQVLQNYLLYRLYHDAFPHGPQTLESQYFHLMNDYFNLRTLCCLWLQCEQPLNAASITAIFSAYSRWKESAPEEDLGDHEGELLLQGISLLTY